MKCTSCRLSMGALKKMKNDHVEFYTAAGRRKLWIAEVDESSQTIRMKRSTGKITWPLDFVKLKNAHDRIEQGELILDPYVIDEVVPTWGNYITGLFKHLGCFK